MNSIEIRSSVVFINNIYFTISFRGLYYEIPLDTSHLTVLATSML